MPTAPTISDLGTRTRVYFETLQETICDRCEAIDGVVKFVPEPWKHKPGGGGLSRVMENGGVFEKGGVNTSTVYGVIPESLANEMKIAQAPFYATGISLVFHPLSPMIPTVHANFRYFELEDGSFWFGGGTDLTPYYVFEEDITQFHRSLKNACDPHGTDLYPRYKKRCDEYFLIKHRGETRGVGGIFFDDVRGEGEKLLAFVRSAGDAFVTAYFPIVVKRRGEPWGQRERSWQLLRRGRYVEFNLVYDRGTLFGLETRGRIESVLMSLPPVARWGYDLPPEHGSREAALLALVTRPREWV